MVPEGITLTVSGGGAQLNCSGLDVRGSLEITDHARLTPTVSVTTYENGAKVYVNYDTEDYLADGVKVPARSYIVEGGEAE